MQRISQRSALLEYCQAHGEFHLKQHRHVAQRSWSFVLSGVGLDHDHRDEGSNTFAQKGVIMVDSQLRPSRLEYLCQRSLSTPETRQLHPPVESTRDKFLSAQGRVRFSASIGLSFTFHPYLA